MTIAIILCRCSALAVLVGCLPWSTAWPIAAALILVSISHDLSS